MINDHSSYQRSLGLMLISENVRWDKEDKFGSICSDYLNTVMMKNLLLPGNASRD
jgi:hypothetical protein